MQNDDTLSTAAPTNIAVLVERMTTLATTVQDIKQRLDHMATKEQVAQMVARPEFERLTWELAQHKRDTENQFKAILESMSARSWRAIFKDWTLIAAAISSTVALYAVFFADKAPK